MTEPGRYCRCTPRELFIRGCRCGAIERERALATPHPWPAGASVRLLSVTELEERNLIMPEQDRVWKYARSHWEQACRITYVLDRYESGLIWTRPHASHGIPVTHVERLDV